MFVSGRAPPEVRQIWDRLHARLVLDTLVKRVEEDHAGRDSEYQSSLSEAEVDELIALRPNKSSKVGRRGEFHDPEACLNSMFAIRLD